MTPKSCSTLQLSKISLSMDAETKALNSVFFPWYFMMNVTKPELSSRWLLTALTFCVECGLNLMFCLIARLPVFVYPVCGHISNLNGRPLSCWMTMTLSIHHWGGVGLSFLCFSYAYQFLHGGVRWRVLGWWVIWLLWRFSVSVGVWWSRTIADTPIVSHLSTLVAGQVACRALFSIVHPFPLGPTEFFLQSKSSTSSWFPSSLCSISGSCTFCRTNSETSVPKDIWAFSSFCHCVAMLIRSFSIGFRSCRSLFCSPRSSTHWRSSSCSQSLGVIVFNVHSSPFLTSFDGPKNLMSIDGPRKLSRVH